ncbi:hypothetical protein DSM112329_03686 [Paraconexibacter sp. AEG42_29]|uniref:Esterase n=1 Tax=Paraconexibacter sp. AEG42_29 TaxID=2997339 RepID=A0AAU7AYT8_9ACTN
MRRVLLATAVLLGLVAAPAAHAGRVQTIELPARGSEVVAQTDYAYPGPPKATVLLPNGYDPAKAYPLVLLLHGRGSDYQWWVEYVKADEVLADLNAVVVMPEASAGWYTDWWGGGRRGAPAWETYFLDQVLPQVRGRYAIRPERRYHAVVGVSMGGMGATYLGGRLPGFFGSVASISGWLDYERYPFVGSSLMGVLNGRTPDPLVVVGPEGSPYSRGHNPRRLVANLAHTRVFLATGDGTLSARGYEPGNEPNGPIANAFEAIVRPMNDSYAEAAQSAGLDVTYTPHAGVHDAPDFRFDLAGAVRWGLFEPVAERPAEWVNQTVATRGQLWDVGYRFDPPPDGVVRFRRSGSRLRVAGARTTAALTFPGGCSTTVVLPADVTVPATPCAVLSVAVRPSRVLAGRRTTVRVQVTPAVPGARVRIGRHQARTDARGRAVVRVCFPGRRTVRTTADAAGHRRGTAPLRVTRAVGRRAC